MPSLTNANCCCELCGGRGLPVSSLQVAKKSIEPKWMGLYGNFDIISDRFSRISPPYPTVYALCTVF